MLPKAQKQQKEKQESPKQISGMLCSDTKKTVGKTIKSLQPDRVRLSSALLLTSFCGKRAVTLFFTVTGYDSRIFVNDGDLVSGDLIASSGDSLFCLWFQSRNKASSLSLTEAA